MKVELDFEHHVCLVTKEDGDPVFRNGGYAGNYAAEHRFFYHIKKALQKQGYDVVKVRCQGLTDERMPCICTRKWKENYPESWVIWDGNYQVRNSALEFNKCGQISLNIEE